MPRGGSRTGKVGQAYQNRSDMNPVPAMLVPPPGAPYGQREQLLQAQRDVPIAPQGTAVAAPQPPAPIGPAEQASPGEFLRPTERPGEPLTHGLASGPGGGAEVLGNMAPTGTISDLLALAANSPGASPDVRALLQWAQGQPR